MSFTATMSNPSPAIRAAFFSALDQLEAGPPALYTILLEKPYKPGQTAASINVQYILSLEHILLPVQLGKAVFKLSTDMKKMVSEWVGGGTACGDAVWLRFMMPKLREAQRKIEMRQWRKAFGILLGLQFFAHGDEEWIMDQGVYRNYREFAGWFSDYSAAWVEVLDRSDSQLGLAVERGRVGGYRGEVMESLKKWEGTTNELLRQEFDEYAGVSPRARVRIFSNAREEEENETLLHLLRQQREQRDFNNLLLYASLMF